jgi:hypothetical protein
MEFTKKRPGAGLNASDWKGKENKFNFTIGQTGERERERERHMAHDLPEISHYVYYPCREMR